MQALFLLYSSKILPVESNRKLACRIFTYCTSAISLKYRDVIYDEIASFCNFMANAIQ